MAKNFLTVTVKACVDDVKDLVEQLKSLQTYKLFEGDDMTLVDIDDVIEIFTNHIRAERMTGDDTEPVLDKIKSIVAVWKMDTWTDNLSHECMLKIAEIIDKAESESKEKLSWLGKNCKDCGNEKCKKLGTLPRGYDCALWQPESEE